MAESLPAVPRVAICIATHRRPHGLRALLNSLDALSFEDLPPAISLIVVDNAPDAPATASLGPIETLTRWPVVYLSEPRPGIVAARNRALDAVPDETDLVAFVDDDETVVPSWLSAHLATRRKTGATATQGPVAPIYETDPPRWIEALRLFHLGPFAEGERLNFAATNNSVVDFAFLRRHGLRFDMRFNQSGGEDEDFYGRLREAGGTIRASADALVHDAVPASRMTQRWVMRRRYRMGNTLGRLSLLRRRGRAVRVAKGIGAMGLGALGAAVFAPFSFERSMAGRLECARGAGMLSAFARLEFSEYSAAALELDRKAGS